MQPVWSVTCLKSQHSNANLIKLLKTVLFYSLPAFLAKCQRLAQKKSSKSTPNAANGLTWDSLLHLVTA